MSRVFLCGAIAVFCLLSVGSPLLAQVVPIASPAMPGIKGPPPPVAPAVQTRDEQGGTTVRAIRLTVPLTMDGKLDEAMYREVAPITGFVQVLPDAGQPSTERTEAWVSFDRTNVYVSARLWVKDMRTLIANELRRDRARQNDDFGVALDTFYDRQTGYLFYTNPIGALGDCQVGEAPGVSNCDFNPVWDVRTGRFEHGWTVEMKFPFKSLRFRPGAAQVWGINMRRTIRHRNETTFLTQMPVSFGSGAIGRLSYAGTLVGIEVPDGSTNTDIKPYAISRLTSDRTTTPALSNQVTSDVGVDVKYGITQNLTADLTYNTDFAQVEADDQQINLTRFNQQFPEKREFFLEGAGIFAGSGGGPALFFSRQIGLDGARQVPILGGVRITGKIRRFSLGALNITTDHAEGTNAPRTNFSVVRVKQDVLKRSLIGATYTGRSRSLAAPGASSHAYGVDAAFNLYDNVDAAGFYSIADTPGTAGGAKASYGASFGYTPDNYGVTLRHLFIDDDFNPEVGFVRRDDIQQTTGTARYSHRTQHHPSVRRVSLTGTLDYVRNTTGFLESYDDTVAFDTEFHSSDAISVSYNRGFDAPRRGFRLTPTLTVPPGEYLTDTVRAAYAIGAQKPYTGTISYEYGGFYGGTQSVLSFTSGRLALTARLAVEPSVGINWIDIPSGRDTTQLYRNRVTYTFTPRMFASAFVQYNSTTSTFGTNVRLRWEYTPGSELFVVYTNDQNMNPRSSSRSSEMLNRAFVVKFNRLFRF